MNIIRKHQKLIEENQRLRNQNTAVKAINNALIYRNAELIKCIRLLVEKKKHLESLNEIHLELIAELYKENHAYSDAAIEEAMKAADEVITEFEKEREQKELTVVIVEPGKEPYVRNIEHKLEAFQKIVEGHIETICDDGLEDMLIICNDEGKINHLRINRITQIGEYVDYIMGTFFVCSMGEYDFCSLTDEQAQRAIKRFSLKKA